MADEKIAKVQCNVCGGKHKYRPAKPKKSSMVKKRVGKTSASKTAGTAQQEKKDAASFEALFKDRDTTEAISYAMTAIFNKNDVIDHPTFGLGLVTATIPADKIEVMFKNGSKILIGVLQRPEASSHGSKLKRKKGRMVKKPVV